MTESVEQRYRSYLEACNGRAWSELDAFVADDVAVNDEPVGLVAYVEGLRAVTRAFPDYRWVIRHLLVDGPLIAAQLDDSGTHRGPFLGFEPTGHRVVTREFAFYRWRFDRIAEVWVTADTEAVRRQLS